MTYKRPAILEDTIQKLFNQSVPPLKILIVDNDPEKSAEEICRKFPGQDISYFPVGYNSGPAGAAYYGLKILAAEGWGWIGWIDDDDPPIFIDTFERLINLGNAHKRCACVGVVGHRLNKEYGIIERLGDHELEGDGFVVVDTIAGGMSKIINGAVIVSTGILPDESLFFGFEELDFDLKLGNAGYDLIAEKNLYLKHRIHFNRLGKQRSRIIINERILRRQYFSSRNMLIIMLNNKFYRALIFCFLKVIVKGVSGFQRGLKIGRKSFYYHFLAIGNFLTNRRGNPFFN